MDPKRKEINHSINMLYRQLGKVVYDDLKKDKLSISGYKKRAGKIDALIRTLRYLEVDMDNVEETEEQLEVLEPAMNEEGIQMYRFCSNCNAGNHPDAKRCVRCGEPM